MPVKCRGAYAASKHALEGLMLCLRVELQASGIHVSLIEPGPIESKIAANGLAWFLKNIDHENSVHREAYEAQLARLRGRRQRSRGQARAGGGPCGFAPRPPVAAAAAALCGHLAGQIGVVLKRLLPASLALPGAGRAAPDRDTESGQTMATVFNILAILVMVAVVIVLIRGLANMMRGGSGNTSNKLMQARVLLQFIALVLILLAV